MGNIIQKVIRVMPVILVVMLIFVDRDNKLYVIGFLSLLFIYTFILIGRVLYAKKLWHKEFNDENYAKDANILKMKGLIEKFDK